MRKSLCFFSAIFILAAGVSSRAQEPPSEPAGRNFQSQQKGTDISIGDLLQSFKRRPLIIDIDARVLEEKQVVVWNETHRKFTIPGSPVGIKLVGANVIVAVQFTPFVRRRGNVLVAQGQIWINDPDKGICYYTSIQTIPMEFGEPIYFFPLGSSQQQDSSIEIKLTVNPNTNAAGTAETTVSTENE